MVNVKLTEQEYKRKIKLRTLSYLYHLCAKKHAMEMKSERTFNLSFNLILTRCHNL